MKSTEIGEASPQALVDRPVKTSGIIQVKLEKYIDATDMARYFRASFKWNQFSSSRTVYAVEDLRTQTVGSSLKFCLDSYRDRVLAKSGREAGYYEVLPITLDCYTDDLTVDDDHSVVLYEFGPADENYSYQALEMHPQHRLASDNLLWLTERLLRIAEALHADDLVLDLRQPIYLVEWQARVLKLMDFYSFRYAKDISYADVRSSLRQIAEAVRELGDFSQTGPQMRQLDAFLSEIEALPSASDASSTTEEPLTVAKFREKYLAIFPEASEAK